MRKTALFALAAALLAAPLAAKPTPARSAHLWHDIVELEQSVNRSDIRDRISEREAAGIRTQIAELKRDYHRLNRNGLTPAEGKALEDRIHRLQARLGNERHDADHHRG